jgi:two-component system heavy metal sensor histidine kinase CusS
MSSIAEAVARRFARVDVRLALAVGGCAALMMSLALALLLAFAVMESLEEKDAEIAREAELVARHDGTELQLPRDLVSRIRTRSGENAGSSGAWPATGAAVQVGMWSALRASPQDYLMRLVERSDGTVVELALPLRHFVHERGEVFRAGAGVLLASLLATAAFGAYAARKALAPLRAATRAVSRIDARHLDSRLPLRATGDDVDALATAINQVLERLEWAFDRMAGFGADVAHELRTPLNRMINAAEVSLLAADDGAPGREEALVVVHDTAEEMARLIDQLLLLAGGEEGRLATRFESIDAAPRVERLVELYEPVADAASQKLSFRGTRAPILADASLLDRAVGNLIENALRHTPRGGEVRVAVVGSDRGCEVSVDDSGPGIPEPDRERVFERFVRLDPARQEGGAGLGLAIARMIVRLHRGEVDATESELGGARFLMRLPCSPDGQSASPDLCSGRAMRVARGRDPRCVGGKAEAATT